MPTVIEQLLSNWKSIAGIVVMLAGGTGTAVQSYRANAIEGARQGNARARFECSDQLVKEEAEHKVCRDNARSDAGALRDDLFKCLESGGTIRD